MPEDVVLDACQNSDDHDFDLKVYRDPRQIAAMPHGAPPLLVPANKAVSDKLRKAKQIPSGKPWEACTGAQTSSS